MGMPPDEAGWPPTAPRTWGGNTDCKDLVAGSTFYLLIAVVGVRFSVGNGHAAQAAESEVSGTSIKYPMERVELTCLRDDLTWKCGSPRASTGQMGFTPYSRMARTNALWEYSLWI